MNRRGLTLPDRLAETLGELVRIPSVNPLHAGPRSGDDAEGPMAVWIAERAEALGAEVVVDQVVDGRCNVYATFAGSSESPQPPARRVGLCTVRRRS